MTISPTWDLFVIVFFVVIIAYSYIIGKNNTVKVILASYIAILTSNGLGNFLDDFLVDRPFINFLPESYGVDTIAVLKISIFLIVALLLVLKGAFQVSIGGQRSRLMSMLMSLVYGFMSAGLIVSTLMIYLTGASVDIITSSGTAIAETNIEFTSHIIATMVNNYSLWFSMPAIVFMIASFVTAEEVETVEEDE
jgi:hypothetical protein